MLLTRRILLNRPSLGSMTMRVASFGPPLCPITRSPKPKIMPAAEGSNDLDGPVNELPRRPSPLSPAVPLELPLRPPLFAMQSGET